MFKKVLVVAILLFFVLVISGVVSAQEATGKVVGKVADQQGAVIVGAKVVVTNVATQISATVTTDADGMYQAQHLPIGNYTVSVEHAGFNKVVTEAYPLEINQSLRVDLTLQVGGGTEAVEVSAAATQVETYNPTIGASVTSRPIINMPLNGRNVLDLAKLEPGVVEQNPGNGAAGTFSIAGGRTDSVTFLLDGGINNNLLDNGVVFNPNPDTVAEFRILESNYGAEYGRNGAGIISVVTKSGGNAFHGSAFDYLRNDAMDANNWFNNYFNAVNGNHDLKNPMLRRNQFGGTLGGPIKKDKAFFFFGYQGQRWNEQVSAGIPDLPTPAMLQGDFSGASSSINTSVANYLVAHPFFQADR